MSTPEITQFQIADTLAPEPLYSRQAEEALVAYILVHPRDFAGIDLDPADFWDNRLRRIWQAIGGLLKAGRDVDPIGLAEVLKASGQDETLYILDLIGGFIVGLNTDTLTAIIKRYALRRRMLTLAEDIAKAAFNPKADLPNQTGEFINRMVSAGNVRQGAVHWSSYLSDLYDQVEERSKNPNDVWGIRTGFDGFDRVTGGLQRGELMLLSGKPGVMKSYLAMQTGLQMAKSAPGVIYSKEMSGLQVVRRLVASWSGVESRKLKSGNLDSRDWECFTSSIEELSKHNVFMSDAAMMTTTSLRSDLARLKAQEGVEWFVLDYLMLLDDMPGGDEIEKTSFISQALKVICRQLDVAGLVVHSMNKEGIGRDNKANDSNATPAQENLRGSGQVIYNADLICFLTEFRPIDPADKFISPKERENMRTLLFGKGRELENPKKFIHFVVLDNARFGEKA